jgi:pilus assembly protein CpaF
VPQVVLHVGRDRDKRRRLSDIAVLRAGEDGRVRVATAWDVDTGFGSAAGDLRNMVGDRGVL